MEVEEVEAVVRTQTHDKMKMQVEPELEMNHLRKNQVHTESNEMMHSIYLLRQLLEKTIFVKHEKNVLA